MANQQSEIKKSYVTLSSLRKNLPEHIDIEEKYVVMLHTEIERLINLGFTDLKDFKIPEEEFYHLQESLNYVSGEETYSKERYVGKNIFKIKLDAILAYFSISSPEVEIGFKTN